MESNQRICLLAISIVNLTVSTGVSIDVMPRTSSIDVQKGDARAFGVINILDAMFISQYLIGSRTNCTTEVNTDCLHAVNAASVHPNGSVDRNTIADALFIAQYLVGLRDESYDLKTPGGQVASILRTSPASGESGVSVTRETIIEFSHSINPATVTPATVSAQFGGENLPARLQVSPPNNPNITLF
jgi:hypothetical protein